MVDIVSHKLVEPVKECMEKQLSDVALQYFGGFITAREFQQKALIILAGHIWSAAEVAVMAECFEKLNED